MVRIFTRVRGHHVAGGSLGESDRCSNPTLAGPGAGSNPAADSLPYNQLGTAVGLQTYKVGVLCGL